MSRNPRIEFEGAVYHVYQRGNNKEYVFKDNIEKEFFIRQLKEYKKAYDYELLAFVIMNNHYHIVIRTGNTPLNRIMHCNNNIYSKFYNFRHKRTGHVFDGRYKSKLVHDDAYLIWLLRYIHRNPVRAHICDEVEQYKWSSDFFYRNNIASFININFILNSLSKERIDSLKAYSELMLGVDDDKNIERIRFQYPTFLFNNGNLDEIHKSEKDMRQSLEDIMLGMNITYTDLGLILSGSRKRSLSDIKVEFIKKAIAQKYTFEEIGNYIGVSQSSISRLLAKKCGQKFILDYNS